MKFTSEQKDRLGKQLSEIFKKLDHTEFGRKIAKAKPPEKDSNSFYPNDYFTRNWMRQVNVYQTDFSQSWYLTEVLNVAKDLIREALFELHAESNPDTQYALQSIDELEAAYREIEKDTHTSELINKLNQIEKNQSEMLKTLTSLLAGQKAIKQESSTKANQQDVSILHHTSHLGNKIDHLNRDVQSISQIVTELNNREQSSAEKKSKPRSSSVFKFGSRQ